MDAFLCHGDLKIWVPLPCLSKNVCPVKLLPRKFAGDLSVAEACHGLCAAHDQCDTYQYNAYGECFLHGGKITKAQYRKDAGKHGTVLCARLGAYHAPLYVKSRGDGKRWIEERSRPMHLDKLYTLQMLAAGAPGEVWGEEM